MKINAAPYFRLPEVWTERAVAESVFEWDGKRILLRQLHNTVLFQMGNAPDGLTFYLRRKLQSGETAANIAESVVAEELKARNFGRFLAHTDNSIRARWRDAELLCLFFAPDGSGYYEDAGEAVPFSWQSEAAGLPDHAALLSAKQEKCKSLCAQVFAKQVWPAMRDPFVSYADTPDEPIRFLSGSCEELHQVTRWICHTEPDLFDAKEGIEECSVAYFSCHASSDGGPEFDYEAALPRHWWLAPPTVSEEDHSPRFVRLCRLAFQHNRFSGATWNTNYYAHREGKTLRRDLWQRESLRERVMILVPTAHERVEAFLELADWLDDKVSAEEKVALLGTASETSAAF